MALRFLRIRGRHLEVLGTFEVTRTRSGGSIPLPESCTIPAADPFSTLIRHSPGRGAETAATVVLVASCRSTNSPRPACRSRAGPAAGSAGASAAGLFRSRSPPAAAPRAGTRTRDAAAEARLALETVTYRSTSDPNPHSGFGGQSQSKPNPARASLQPSAHAHTRTIPDAPAPLSENTDLPATRLLPNSFPRTSPRIVKWSLVRDLVAAHVDLDRGEIDRKLGGAPRLEGIARERTGRLSPAQCPCRGATPPLRA